MVYRIAALAMAKPSFTTRTDIHHHHQSMASDLSVTQRTTSCSRVSSTRRGDLIFVVNPKGANGQTGEDWKKLLPYLRSHLGKDRNICECLTSGPSHAIDITREAIREGADAVVAVGGDGTLHEVVNGFFWAGKPVCANDQEISHTTALGLIPLGTGSDFARTFGWKNDPHEAIGRISRGLRSRIDVGVINGEIAEPHHYFVNVADIHLSAKAGYHSSRYKRFGKLCYVFGALRAFIGHKNQNLRIKVNGGDWEVIPQVTTLSVGNAKFYGGGMKISPNADPCSGNLEVVTLQDFKWYDFILKMHKLYNGTHLSEKNVVSRSQANLLLWESASREKRLFRLASLFISHHLNTSSLTDDVCNVQSIEVEEVEGSGSIYVQSDGEHLGFLPRKFSIIPAAIEMLC